LAQGYFTLAKLNSLLNNWSELAGFSRLLGFIILIPVIGAEMEGFRWLGLASAFLGLGDRSGLVTEFPIQFA
jgi:hypothetical protein